MGAGQSSPEPSAPSCPQPVYDSTTCKEFVGTGCSKPVYDSTTCKEFVGTGCSKPVYDSTTCKEFVGTGCPQPVYDSTTCKEFVGTGCPQPVYDSTTCKEFVGKGCPQPVYDSTTCKEFVGKGCPQPVYDSTTCANVIKTALDAKKCAPILGIQYNDSNENVKNVMVSFQNIINKLQEILCSSQFKHLAFDMLNEYNSTDTITPQDPKILRDQAQKMFDQNTYKTIYKEYGMSIEQFNELKKLILVLRNVLITVCTDLNGMVNSTKIKETTFEIINSLCSNYKERRRTIPYYKVPKGAINTSSELFKTERKLYNKDGIFSLVKSSGKGIVDRIRINKLNFDLTKLKNPNSTIVFEVKASDSINNELYKIEVTASNKVNHELPVIIDINGRKLDAYLNCYIDPSESNTDFGVIGIDSEMVLINKDTTAVIPNFGDMIGYSISKFGSMKTVLKTFLLIFLFIIVVIVFGVLFSFIKPEKKKIPSIPRRIAAAFGRQIKAIRKM